jgi:hypothetical protein
VLPASKTAIFYQTHPWTCNPPLSGFACRENPYWVYVQDVSGFESIGNFSLLTKMVPGNRPRRFRARHCALAVANPVGHFEVFTWLFSELLDI